MCRQCPRSKPKVVSWDVGGFTAAWWKASRMLSVTWAPGKGGSQFVPGRFSSFADAKLGAHAFIEELKGRGISAGDLRREDEKLRIEQVMFTVDAARRLGLRATGTQAGATDLAERCGSTWRRR